MRIVPNLNEINECPCCGSNTLALYIHEDLSLSDYKKCSTCGEKVYTNETTYSEGQHAVYHMKKAADVKEEWFEQKRKEKENFIFEMREEISNLTWSISINDAHVVLVENIQNILNRIIDYIEEN
jgi:transcription elongation factor Elf1